MQGTAGSISENVTVSEAGAEKGIVQRESGGTRNNKNGHG